MSLVASIKAEPNAPPAEAESYLREKYMKYIKSEVSECNCCFLPFINAELKDRWRKNKSNGRNVGHMLRNREQHFLTYNELPKSQVDFLFCE